MVEVKVSRRKVWKKEGEKGDFTEWPKRRMFSRQREAYLCCCSRGTAAAKGWKHQSPGALRQ